ncbi:hypothetical protein [Fodinicola feengrottensis]|nr:hypothetical protein [Fodinicola feengrottensis]
MPSTSPRSAALWCRNCQPSISDPTQPGLLAAGAAPRPLICGMK